MTNKITPTLPTAHFWWQMYVLNVIKVWGKNTSEGGRSNILHKFTTDFVIKHGKNGLQNPSQEPHL